MTPREITKYFLSKSFVGFVGEETLESTDIEVTELWVSVQHALEVGLPPHNGTWFYREIKGSNAACTNSDCSNWLADETIQRNARDLRPSISCCHSFRNKKCVRIGA